MFCFYGNKKDKQCGFMCVVVGKVVFNNILVEVLYVNSVIKLRELILNNNN